MRRSEGATHQTSGPFQLQGRPPPQPPQLQIQASNKKPKHHQSNPAPHPPAPDPPYLPRKVCQPSGPDFAVYAALLPHVWVTRSKQMQGQGKGDLFGWLLVFVLCLFCVCFVGCVVLSGGGVFFFLSFLVCVCVCLCISSVWSLSLSLSLSLYLFVLCVCLSVCFWGEAYACWSW